MSTERAVLLAIRKILFGLSTASLLLTLLSFIFNTSNVSTETSLAFERSFVPMPQIGLNLILFLLCLFHLRHTLYALRSQSSSSSSLSASERINSYEPITRPNRPQPTTPSWLRLLSQFKYARHLRMFVGLTLAVLLLGVSCYAYVILLAVPSQSPSSSATITFLSNKPSTTMSCRTAINAQGVGGEFTPTGSCLMQMIVGAMEIISGVLLMVEGVCCLTISPTKETTTQSPLTSEHNHAQDLVQRPNQARTVPEHISVMQDQWQRRIDLESPKVHKVKAPAMTTVMPTDRRRGGQGLERVDPHNDQHETDLSDEYEDQDYYEPYFVGVSSAHASNVRLGSADHCMPQERSRVRPYDGLQENGYPTDESAGSMAANRANRSREQIERERRITVQQKRAAADQHLVTGTDFASLLPHPTPPTPPSPLPYPTHSSHRPLMHRQGELTMPLAQAETEFRNDKGEQNHTAIPFKMVPSRRPQVQPANLTTARQALPNNQSRSMHLSKVEQQSQTLPPERHYIQQVYIPPVTPHFIVNDDFSNLTTFPSISPTTVRARSDFYIRGGLGKRTRDKLARKTSNHRTNTISHRAPDHDVSPIVPSSSIRSRVDDPLSENAVQRSTRVLHSH